MFRFGRLTLAMLQLPSASRDFAISERVEGESVKGKRSLVIDLGERGELLSLNVCQKRAAAGRDMGHASAKAELFDRFGGLAASHNGDPLTRRHGGADRFGAGAERRLLEPAD